MANYNHHHNTSNDSNESSESVPLCRCRVLYIGSAVPIVTKDGLQGIQQPLKERYPANENTETKGIDSWLSVWSNGLLLEYVDGNKRTESTFFPIVTLHYCAAVRYVNVSGFSIEGGGERFIPLDTPFAHVPDSPHPPIFAAIFRRTTGIKVLECHAFICTNERAANALVRCCFHSYADTIYLKMDEKIGTPGLKAIKESSRSITPTSDLNTSEQENGNTNAMMAIDEIREETNWNERAIGQKTWQRRQQNGEYDSSSIVSSVFKKSPKKNSKRMEETRNESFEAEGILMPFVENSPFRKAGSHGDIRGECYESGYERGNFPPHGNMRPPFNRAAFFPTHIMFGDRAPPMPPPPPPQFLQKYPPPPPHLLPPHLRQQLPPIPPPLMFGRFGGAPVYLPPHMMPPPRCVPMMPPPFGPHPYFLMERNAAAAKVASDMPVGSGPIISESLYDTFPRHRSTYEEPIYMSSNGTLPPNSSYKPNAMSPENYESVYYETYKRCKASPEQKSGSDSDISGEGSQNNNRNNQFWETYEANIYRKAHINEKAFANTVAGSINKNEIPHGHYERTRQNDSIQLRPDTPPADYDLETSSSNPVAHGENQSRNTAPTATVY